MKLDSEVMYGPCPCGSGKKFKFCCFAEVRDSLPPDADADYVTEAVRTRKHRVLDLYKDSGVDVLSAAERIGDKGIDALHKGDARKALEYFRAAHEKLPNLFSAWNNEAVCLLLLGEITAARESAERAIACAPDINAFGWAVRAIIACVTGEAGAYAESIARATEIKPLDSFTALRVCEALACDHRHREVLDYAEASGFASNEDVAYMAGVAAANCGEKDVARKHLARVRNGKLAECAEVVYDGMDEGWHFLKLFEWLYFDEEKYPCGLLSDDIPADSELAHMPDAKRAALVCHKVEVDLSRREVFMKKDALKILEEIDTPRAAKIREFLATTDEFDKKPKGIDDMFRSALGLTPGTGGHSERFMECLKKVKVKKGVDSLLPIPDDDPGIDDYVYATGIALDDEPSHPEWEWAKETLHQFAEKYPYNPRALMNYAGMLSREGCRDEVEAIVRRLYESFPYYAFAVGSMAKTLVTKGDLDGAERVMDGFAIPDEMSPQDYIELLRTEQAIARERGRTGWALRCMAKEVETKDAFPDDFPV